tara:strand:+ start:152 stop:1057 length:906 start_codon:yes stop_codon:yes gene_type:complete
MAETLTYDPTPADQTEFTEEEQNSLEVGEKLAEQEGELLAGKYKDAQELEQAYIELQKKLGSDKQESKEDVTEDSPESTDKEQEKPESSEDPNYKDGYLEDGKVNYERVNEVYGDKLGKVFEDAELDPFSISKEFHDNKGSLSEESKQKLIDSGLSEASVDSYLAGRASESGYDKSGSIEDLTDKEAMDIYNSVGGQDEYNKILKWAVDNIPEKEAEAFDSIVNTGKSDAIQLLVSGLKARYEEANGYEGRMLTGKAAQANTDVFRSQAEVVRAMNDPRYESDPAYRLDVFEKLDRSDINF